MSTVASVAASPPSRGTRETPEGLRLRQPKQVSGRRLLCLFFERLLKKSKSQKGGSGGRRYTRAHRVNSEGN